MQQRSMHISRKLFSCLELDTIIDRWDKDKEVLERRIRDISFFYAYAIIDVIAPAESIEHGDIDAVGQPSR